jgi:protoheme IX farnesyltransferase
MTDQSAIRNRQSKLRAYWTLIKSLQTGLLLVTGLAGYMSARCPLTTWQTLLAVVGSLFLAIGGSTVFNMVYDRDIDADMKRTCQRPLPAGLVTVKEALLLGFVLSTLGVGWALAMSPLYGLVVFAGLFCDVMIYTIWLKRRTPWSIVWGGIAGGMPVLAGRALGLGQLDLIGLLLSLAVLLWIPTHIMTLSIKYADDYRRARVPVFPNVYGERFTRLLLGLSTVGAAITMLLAAWLIGLRWGYLQASFGLGLLLLGFALVNVLRNSPRLNFVLFKTASLYMLTSMLLIIAGV